MKLAEALAERSDLTKKLGELRSRVSDSMYTSLDSPAVEDANALLAQAHEVVERLERLIRAINTTNITTPFSLAGVERATLMDALARRDMLASKHKTLVEALSSTGRRGRWYGEAQSGTVTVDVAQVRSDADRLARELRTLDLAIQQANWSTDLVR